MDADAALKGILEPQTDGNTETRTRAVESVQGIAIRGEEG
jgi:hypothetical protein